MRWDRILYIPAFRQPFKADREHASGHHRFAMTILGTLERDELFVLTTELDRGSISFTVDTLEELRTAYTDATLDWIIGDDNLAQLLQWKSIDRILELANFCVLTRNGGEALPLVLRQRVASADTRPSCGAVVFAENPTVTVSSTEIRTRVAAGESIDGLVDPRISRYIHHYGLYRKEQA
jgi:nicotinate-nucleotide adenylyltransferase